MLSGGDRPSSSVTELASRWADADPNPTTREYVRGLVSRAAEEEAGDSGRGDAANSELRSLFPSNGSRIGFGTAGLRSRMMPGPLGMNDLVVVQTVQGLARYCLSLHDEGPKVGGGGGGEKGGRLLAVVGFDHRCNPDLDLSSRSFAVFAKLAFEEAGMDCVLLDRGEDGGYVHTPLVAYAVTNLGAAVGCMVTASHNPKNDDGFKVYWSDGCQIRPPLDAEIAAYIAREENLNPWADYGAILARRREELGGGTASDTDPCLGLGNRERTEELATAYFEAMESSGLVAGVANKLLAGQPDFTPPRVAYTAMHGVGRPWAARSYETFGLRPFLSVPAQEAPDPEFPTAPFPNPEERGALDVAVTFAEEEGCDVILANDPDADRLAMAERCREDGKWTVFTGDQIGSMLGHWIWESIGKSSDKPVAMCASTVSSVMLSAIAKREGFHFEDTLTGFKWIGSRSIALRSEGYRVLFGYEEAIGFSCGEMVADKDGITALGVMTELAYSVYGRGLSLARHMQSLYDKYGEFVSNNGYFFCHDPAIALEIFDKIRTGHGGSYPAKVGTYAVESIRDLGSPGYDSSTPDKKPRLPTSASSPMITLRFDNGCVAQFRASGTEPKFKYYIEMQGQPGVSRGEVMEKLLEMSEVLLNVLLEPDANGLVRPKL